jgi:hypothetical protein
MDGLLRAGRQYMERETGVQPVVINERERRDRRERSSTAASRLCRLFLQIALYVRGVGNAFVEPAPEHRVFPFFVCCVLARFRSFLAFSLASLSQLLVGYPINSKAYHFVRIRKTELLFDVRSMCLDGFDAEIDLFRDGTCAVPAA